MKARINQSAAFDICMGETPIEAGRLIYTKNGQRQHSMFEYAPSWLAREDAFTISPDLPLAAAKYYQAGAGETSPFHLAIADTEPDAWGRKVIQRDHAKRRRADPSVGPLTEMDVLSAVDDESRIGAIRLRDADGVFVRPTAAGQRRTPIDLTLRNLHRATAAVERNAETQADLDFLLGKGTSLGGLRPKSTIHYNGTLAIGKFPSVSDERDMPRAEVLALHLATRAGIRAAKARIVVVDNAPIAVIDRFDREDGGRVPYLSAHSFLRGDPDATYFTLAEEIRASGSEWRADLQELWRRLVFNLLITNVDDHLHNTGFLHDGFGKWRLSPAFDVNPFPERARESKTMLSMDQGPISDIQMLLNSASEFGLELASAEQIVRNVHGAVSGWRAVAHLPEIGMSAAEQNAVADAFEHDQMEVASRI